MSLLFFNYIADIRLIMLFWRDIIWCINSWTFFIYICCQFSDFPNKTCRICPINLKNGIVYQMCNSFGCGVFQILSLVPERLHFCYIFAAGFFNPERDHFWNQEESFLFHFKSSFCFQENRSLEFYIFKFHGVIKCLSIKQGIHVTE